MLITNADVKFVTAPEWLQKPVKTHSRFYLFILNFLKIRITAFEMLYLIYYFYGHQLFEDRNAQTLYNLGKAG